MGDQVREDVSNKGTFVQGLEEGEGERYMIIQGKYSMEGAASAKASWKLCEEASVVGVECDRAGDERGGQDQKTQGM